jgi:glycine cleavage system regulatory protein
MMTSLAVTVVGPDRPGLINSISDAAASHGANWLESHMANLAGQFAGIVRLQVPPANVEPLVAALRELESIGLHVTVAKGAGESTSGPSRMLSLELVGQDHPGIVRDISRALAARNISIEELVTESVSGSMSGENLFRANARLCVPATVSTEELNRVLESLADELMVDVTLEEEATV